MNTPIIRRADGIAADLLLRIATERPHQARRNINLNEKKTPQPQRFPEVALLIQLSFSARARRMGTAGHAFSLEGGIKLHARQEAAPALEHGEKTCSII
jgi:hypothetical protein